METTNDGASIAVSNIVVRYKEFSAVDHVSFDIKAGEFVSLLGPSGSGKTTILRAVAGFVPLSSGDIRIGPTVINTVPTRFRNFGMVFQNYALFQNMTVRQNVAFGLIPRKMRRQVREAAVSDILHKTDLTEQADKYPAQLSGGQQQRVALARAIVIKPRLLLMDEPLAALDLKLRQRLQLRIREIQQEFGISTLYVTHDQEEALTLSDRILVMNKGVISAHGSSEEIYRAPQSRFAAEFIGNKTVLSAHSHDGRIHGLPGQIGEIDVSGMQADNYVVVVNPEDIDCGPRSTPNAACGDIVGRRISGSTELLTIKVGDHTLSAQIKAGELRGAAVAYFSWPSDAAHVIAE